MRLELEKPEVGMGIQEELPFQRLAMLRSWKHMFGRRAEQRAGRPTFILEVLKVPKNTPKLLDLIEGECEPRYEKLRQ